MKFSIRGTFAAIGVASVLAAGVTAPANAAGGDFVAGAIIGGLVGGAIAHRPYYANPPGPGYAPPPTYVAPRVCYRKEKYWDAYSGWGWRRVQYYC